MSVTEETAVPYPVNVVGQVPTIGCGSKWVWREELIKVNLHRKFKTQDIIRTNVLTKLHESVLKRVNATHPAGNVIQQARTIFELIQQMKTAPSPGGHVFQTTRTIFILVQAIVRTNLLTNIHEDRTIKVASRVLTSHVFQKTKTIFKIIQDIIRINILTKLNEDLLTRKCPAPLRPCFSTRTIFELEQVINGKKLLTKFYEDGPLNVTPRVLTRFHYTHIYVHLMLHTGKCPVPWRPCFSGNRNNFGANSRVLTRKNAPPPGVHKKCPAPLRSWFHDDQTINLASRVLTRTKAPPPRDHVFFQPTRNIFELLQDIIGTNLLTKFHVDRKINVASRVLTKLMLTTDKRKQFTPRRTINITFRVLTRLYTPP
ncbi:hypothetical protein DPMN_189954 [Dreissena polymorpha]|uniref:Uncharacterized protein n=1 Tax=Dreissena polymorpha TaxID=45954 RepID=A0A9D4DU26_DREPO|nr:hypothetical protein DPMN_189954 [Dreissena polymorpha]